MKERDVQHAVLMHIGARPFLRVWRQNVGVAVPIAVTEAALRALESGDVAKAIDILRRKRVVRFGVPGAADLSGLFACGKRLELEIKTQTGRQSQEQKNFQGVVDTLSGFYGIARSVESADAELANHLQSCDVCSSVRGNLWRA